MSWKNKRKRLGQKKYLKKNTEVVIERLKNPNLSGIFPINEASGPDGFTGKFYEEEKILTLLKL